MNFTSSKIWNNSFYLRYPIEKIKRIQNLYFYCNNNILSCNNFFEFKLEDDTLEKLKNEINNKKILKFRYINQNDTFNKFKKWAQLNQFTFELLDSWSAPKLFLTENISDYFKNNIHSQVKRNYSFYIKNKENFKIYNSDSYSKLKLWKYVLEIDNNSWKKKENSDMKSLGREDLQYLPFLLTKSKKSNLVVVCDKSNNPLGYSLFFKDQDEWFAVKWGASNEGRKEKAGFVSLFYQLEYIYSKEKQINIDFWGRNNQTYEYLKNQDINRNHILIYKKEN